VKPKENTPKISAWNWDRAFLSPNFPILTKIDPASENIFSSGSF
jgi:hypothetical protein